MESKQLSLSPVWLSDNLTCAVKKHVETVRDQAQGVGPNLTIQLSFQFQLAELWFVVSYPVEQLDECEWEVEDEEAEEIPAVGVRHDEPDPANHLLSPSRDKSWQEKINYFTKFFFYCVILYK